MGDLFGSNKNSKNDSGKSLIPVLGIIIVLFLIGIGSTPVEIQNDIQISGDKEIKSEEYIQSNDKIINKETEKESSNIENKKDFSKIRDEELAKIPSYSKSPYYVVNNNVPFFNDLDLVTNSYEKYGELDNLRKMYGNNCLYRKRYNANCGKRQYR